MNEHNVVWFSSEDLHTIKPVIRFIKRLFVDYQEQFKEVPREDMTNAFISAAFNEYQGLNDFQTYMIVGEVIALRRHAYLNAKRKADKIKEAYALIEAHKGIVS